MVNQLIGVDISYRLNMIIREKNHIRVLQAHSSRRLVIFFSPRYQCNALKFKTGVFSGITDFWSYFVCLFMVLGAL